MPSNVWTSWGGSTQCQLNSGHKWYVGNQWVGHPKGWHAILFLAGKVMLTSPTFTTLGEAQAWASSQLQPLPIIPKKKTVKKTKTAWERLMRKPTY